ncbi:hypothetical protein E6H26_02460 [Candidatus Bathyarchaeota archaeon]|nr:MAG: hypothetical protein E6H26_02460 [Candidatus Bathyarchaeota archaeon]
MAEGTYKRMFLRWEIIRGWMPGIVFAAIAVAIEILYFEYMLSRGLADETFSVSLGIVSLPLSISLFLSLGNAIVLLVLWMSVFESTAYVMAGPDRRVRRLLYPLRMIRAAALVLAPFTLVLFAPYIIESGWFISIVSGVSNSNASLQQTAAGFYTWAFSVAMTDASVKFVASQLSAALASTVVAGLQIWRVKGTRNLMLLLRRRKK